jgi:hypothetical protein
LMPLCLCLNCRLFLCHSQVCFLLSHPVSFNGCCSRLGGWTQLKCISIVVFNCGTFLLGHLIPSWSPWSPLGTIKGRLLLGLPVVVVRGGGRPSFPPWSTEFTKLKISSVSLSFESNESLQFRILHDPVVLSELAFYAFKFPCR